MDKKTWLDLTRVRMTNMNFGNKKRVNSGKLFKFAIQAMILRQSDRK